MGRIFSQPSCAFEGFTSLTMCVPGTVGNDSHPSRQPAFEGPRSQSKSSTFRMPWGRWLVQWQVDPDWTFSPKTREGRVPENWSWCAQVALESFVLKKIIINRKLPFSREIMIKKWWMVCAWEKADSFSRWLLSECNLSWGENNHLQYLPTFTFPWTLPNPNCQLRPFANTISVDARMLSLLAAKVRSKVQ